MAEFPPFLFGIACPYPYIISFAGFQIFDFCGSLVFLYPYFFCFVKLPVCCILDLVTNSLLILFPFDQYRIFFYLL